MTSPGKNNKVLRWLTMKPSSTDEHWSSNSIFLITEECKNFKITFFRAGESSSKNLSRSCYTSGVSWIYCMYLSTLSCISCGSFRDLMVWETISSCSWKKESFLLMMAIKAAMFPKMNEVTKAPRIITDAEYKVWPNVIGEISFPSTSKIEL